MRERLLACLVFAICKPAIWMFRRGRGCCSGRMPVARPTNLICSPGRRRDQALIAGVSAAAAFGWATTSHSFLRSVADRLPGATGSARGLLISGLIVDGFTAVAGLATARALPPAPPSTRESNGRALVRLAANTTAASALAGIGAALLEPTHRRRGGRLLTLGVTLATWGASFALSRPTRAQRRHRRVRITAPRGRTSPGWCRCRPPSRSVRRCRCRMIGVAMVESALSDAVSKVAAQVLGGTPNDRRTAGRLVASAHSPGSARPESPGSPGNSPRPGKTSSWPTRRPHGPRGHRRTGFGHPAGPHSPGKADAGCRWCCGTGH